MKYLFNSPLLRSIPNILGMSPYAMMKNITSCSYDTLKNNLRDGDIKFATFIELCNEFHLNIYAFFYPAKEQPADPVILPSDSYQELTFRPELMQHYMKQKRFAWCSDVAEWMSSKRWKKMKLPVEMAATTHQTVPTPHTRSPKGAMEVDAGSSSISSNSQEEKNIQTNVTTPLAHSVERGRGIEAACFNLLLLSSLPSILGVERTEIGKVVGRQGNMLLFALRSRDIRMRTLVDICNHFHINIRLFFTDREYLPMNVVVPEDKWQPITFHPERLLDFAPYGDKMQLVRKLGWYIQRFNRNIDPATTPMTAQNFIEVLTTLHLSPSYFFDAPEVIYNERIERQLNATIEKKDAAIASKDDQIAQLLKEKRMLESKLRHSEAMRRM